MNALLPPCGRVVAGVKLTGINAHLEEISLMFLVRSLPPSIRSFIFTSGRQAHLHSLKREGRARGAGADSDVIKEAFPSAPLAPSSSVLRVCLMHVMLLRAVLRYVSFNVTPLKIWKAVSDLTASSKY